MVIDPTTAADLGQGLRQGLLVGAALLTLVLPPGIGGGARSHNPLSPGPIPVLVPVERRLDFGGEVPAPDARRLARWVVATADNGDLPFAIVDKARARVHLFQPSGQLLAASPVLLGYARGDDSVAGIGLRPIAEVRASERTTPAGRFVARPGRNTQGEDVLWVDYDAAVSMHRVRAGEPREQRLARLASPSARDNRISYGCINLPATFFDHHFWPHFGARTSIIYILPETRPLESVFPAVSPWVDTAPAAPASGT